MRGVALEVSPAASSDQLEVVEVGALNEAEAGYARAARAANTLRGYRSDWPSGAPSRRARATTGTLRW